MTSPSEIKLRHISARGGEQDARSTRCTQAQLPRVARTREKYHLIIACPTRPENRGHVRKQRPWSRPNLAQICGAFQVVDEATVIGRPSPPLQGLAAIVDHIISPIVIRNMQIAETRFTSWVGEEGDVSKIGCIGNGESLHRVSNDGSRFAIR